MNTIGRRDLPERQQQALKQAIRWEWITIAYTLVTILVVSQVVGNSQAMKTAWIEDMLSLIPQLSFLIALLFIRRPSSKSHPFGMHRAMSIAHLVAGVALFAVGANLGSEATMGLITAERPTIGTVQFFSETVWLGWIMIAVMSVIVIGPLIYGPAKLRLAPVLHNKVLYADADMAQADWHTNVATIVGVLGVGLGLWWLDGVAALVISISIVRDGIRNTSFAVRDLLDEQARTHDDSAPHPLAEQILKTMRRYRWLREVGIRVRDQGQVFHVEVFIVPRGKRPPRVAVLEQAAVELSELDWKMQDIVMIPASVIPEEAVSY